MTDTLFWALVIWLAFVVVIWGWYVLEFGPWNDP
jgi:hypothetical protein